MNCDRCTQMEVSRFLSGHLRSLAFQGGHKTYPTCPKCNIEQASPTHILICLVGAVVTLKQLVETLGGRGSLVVKVTNSWTACWFEPITAQDPPCRGDRCMLNLLRLKRPPVGVVWKLGESVPNQVSSLTMVENYEVRRQKPLSS
ncbi:hypothetical protein TNCV_4404341 [Trichonephila clavipes]|uniref:Uncharacterized protein n=1 Tax=Trichonephila clavipes TaxID=2585209 RepID=A0A8X6V5N8_TRICX|nr:hypothetical protein TNCV_4404341 [Trichonephila clavipes]